MTIQNGSLLSNAEASYAGGLIYGDSAGLIVLDSTLEYGVAGSKSGDGVAVRSTSSSTTEYSSYFSYNAWFENVATNSSAVGATLTLDSTNLFSDPLLAGWSDDGDCTNDRLWPADDSPLIDAGDPDTSDSDGSAVDMGVYGGEEAEEPPIIDMDGDGFDEFDDCDDSDASIYPGATEECDGVDNDCDGAVDEGLATSTWYQDGDDDGYGSADVVIEDCAHPNGFVATDGDCDDDAESVHPGAPELCDGLDNDCNLLIDDDVQDLTWYLDEDGDGYGNRDVSFEDCDGVDGNKPIKPFDEDLKTVGNFGCTSAVSPLSALPLLTLFPFLLRRRRKPLGR